MITPVLTIWLRRAAQTRRRTRLFRPRTAAIQAASATSQIRNAEVDRQCRVRRTSVSSLGSDELRLIANSRTTICGHTEERDEDDQDLLRRGARQVSPGHARQRSKAAATSTSLSAPRRFRQRRFIRAKIGSGEAGVFGWSSIWPSRMAARVENRFNVLRLQRVRAEVVGGEVPGIEAHFGGCRAAVGAQGQHGLALDSGRALAPAPGSFRPKAPVGHCVYVMQRRRARLNRAYVCSARSRQRAFSLSASRTGGRLRRIRR